MKDKDQEWYTNTFEVLNPLRWHLSELLEAVEQFNRLAIATKEAPIFEKKIADARDALNKAEKFLTK